MTKDTPFEIPFNYFENDYLVVRIKINDLDEKDFILDTGIGITLISKSLCEEIKCKVNGEHIGKRMSGQDIHVPLSKVKSIEIGGRKLLDFPVGLFDVEALLPNSNISGFLSLEFFKELPHTVDYKMKVIRFETESSLAKIRSTGTVVPVTIEQQGPSFGVSIPLILPNGQQIRAEVDTGSQSLVLHERYMKPLGIFPNDPKVKRREGRDETGHTYSRYFSLLQGAVHLPGADHMKIDDPSAMFQQIIYDGLVGFYFLREFLVTYDLQKSEMIFRV